MRKKFLLILSILVISLSFAACSSDKVISDGVKQDANSETYSSNSESNTVNDAENGTGNNSEDTDEKTALVESMIGSYEPPAETISIDMTADDPSNDKIVFTFQGDGKIQNYVYWVNGIKVMVTYGYDSINEGQIWVLAFSEDGTVIGEDTFNYAESEGSGFSEHNGYYFKDVVVSDAT